VPSTARRSSAATVALPCSTLSVAMPPTSWTRYLALGDDCVARTDLGRHHGYWELAAEPWPRTLRGRFPRERD
jgi:hypothetical protein